MTLEQALAAFLAALSGCDVSWPSTHSTPPRSSFLATIPLGPERGSTVPAFPQGRTTAGEGLAKRLEGVLAPVRFPVRSNPAQWSGEGEEWVRLSTLLLSLASRSPLFHTAADLPEHATSPEQLVVTQTAVSQAAQLFLEESLSA